MLHISESLNLPVFAGDGRRLGRLHDVVVDPVRCIVVRILVRARRSMSHVPWGGIEKFSPETRRVDLVQDTALAPGMGTDGDLLLLKRDVLDRQIIDIHGRKVVKVNDIQMESSGRDLKLRHVDVGLAGAVRRLLVGIIAPRLVRRIVDGLPAREIPWDFVGLVEPGSTPIRLRVHQQLARLHPADLADIIEDLGRIERYKIVSSLDRETAAQALSEVEPDVQASVVEAIKVEHAADLLEEMQPDEAADILADLPEARSRALLQAMEKEDAEDVRGLLRFRENSAGGLMTTEFFRARADWTAGRTVETIRDVDPDLLGELDEIPVVGNDDRLVGVVPLVRLVRLPADQPVTSAMRREARAVTPTAPFKEVVDRFEKYHLRALAVVNEFGVLIGLISIEDVLSRLATGD